MKYLYKILLAILFVFTASTVSAQTVSQHKIYQDIFKIKSYKYNSFSKSFVLDRTWSWVLVAKNQIITNSHVVSDEEENTLNYYIICKTTDYREKPDCRYAGILTKLDQKNDLALLQVLSLDLQKQPVSLKPMVVLNTEQKELGDDIDIYWYPGIWGDTITYTQWKLSGYDKGFAKTDATIDQWNSGGGAFVDGNKLFGIPTLINSNYSTLWYITPYSKIKVFMSQPVNKLQDFDKSKFITFFKSLAKNYQITQDLTLWSIKLTGILKDYDMSSSETTQYYDYVYLESKDMSNSMIAFRYSQFETVIDEAYFKIIQSGFFDSDNASCNINLPYMVCLYYTDNKLTNTYVFYANTSSLLTVSFSSTVNPTQQLPLITANFLRNYPLSNIDGVKLPKNLNFWSLKLIKDTDFHYLFGYTSEQKSGLYMFPTLSGSQYFGVVSYDEINSQTAASYGNGDLEKYKETIQDYFPEDEMFLRTIDSREYLIIKNKEDGKYNIAFFEGNEVYVIKFSYQWDDFDSFDAYITEKFPLLFSFNE